jgi:hypothetical protein
MLGLISMQAGNCIHPAAFGPEDIVVSDPREFVRAARTLIAGPPSHSRRIIQDEQLPAALRASRIAAPRLGPFVSVRCARVETDHLDVVLAQQRDGDFGARVWAITRRPQGDEPTRYADIYFYVYTYDERESPDTPVCNIP